MPTYKIQDIKRELNGKITISDSSSADGDKKAKRTSSRKPAKEESFDEETVAENRKSSSGADESEASVPKLERKNLRRKANIASRRGKGSSKLRIFTIILILVIVLVGGYFTANYFARVNIAITNKTQAFTLDHKQFTASKASNAVLPFEIMIVSDEDHKDMILTESQNVSTKAKGTIILYNEYSTKAQSISVGSYVSDPSGKTYKTDKAVSIPGYTLDKAKKVIPGKVSVNVTAFLPGPSYNGNQINFTINAYKGTSKFTKIYGKASSPMSGGAQGLVYVLGAADKGVIDAFAGTSFRSALLKKASAQVPTGYILYPNAVRFSYQSDSSATYQDKNAKVTIDGTVTAFLVKEKDISRMVEGAVLPDIGEAELKEIQIPDISKMSFDFADKNQVITKDLQTLSFTLTGPLTAVWHPDTEALKISLKGIPKSGVASIFKQDNGIANAHVTFFPPWQTSVPEDVSRIHISIK